MLDNHIGGIQVITLAVIKELRKYGIETVLVVPKGEGDFAPQALKEGFKVYQVLNSLRPLGIVSIPANLRWVFTSPLTVFTIAGIINKEAINIVHLNGLLNLQAAIAALLMRRKII